MSNSPPSHHKLPHNLAALGAVRYQTTYRPVRRACDLAMAIGQSGGCVCGRSRVCGRWGQNNQELTLITRVMRVYLQEQPYNTGQYRPCAFNAQFKTGLREICPLGQLAECRHSPGFLRLKAASRHRLPPKPPAMAVATAH
jgi:hypothetical protein